jgi:hypothetical protein
VIANRAHAPLQGSVGDLVLNGVAAFVGGDAERGERSAMEVLRRKHQALVRGVVVVAEQFIVLDDVHVMDAGAIQDARGGLARRVMPELAGTWLYL